MSRRVINSPEIPQSSAVIERGLPRWTSRVLVAGAVTVGSMIGIGYVGLGHERVPNGQMTIEAAPDETSTTKLPKAEPPEIPDEEDQRQILQRHQENNEHLANRLEAQNQVAELVDYRLRCGEGQDVFWGTVSIFDTKANRELANITNPILVTPRSMGWNLEDNTTPYAVVGIVPGKPTAAAPSPWQKITPDAFVVNDRDVLAIFTDYAGHSATYPQLDVQTLDVPDSYIRGVAPTARYDLAGDIFSLQLADGSAVGQMNPVMPGQKAAA